MTAHMEQESWRSALDAVTAFVADHPQIKCSATCLGVPKSCREELYQTLDEARSTLVTAALEDEASESAGATASTGTATGTTSGSGAPDAAAPQANRPADRLAFADRCVAGLEDLMGRFAQQTGASILLPAELQAFCKDRILGCSEPLVGSMLSFVQGTRTADELYAEVRRDAVAAFDQLSICAYETWLFYSVALMLGAKRAYLADTFDQKTVVTTATDTLPLGRQGYSPVLRLPEAVFDCDGTYWAMKLELAHELDFYASKPLRRRDFSAGGDTRGTIGRRMLMLYRVPDLDHVPIVANRDTKLVYPPFAMVGTLSSQDFGGNLYGRACMQRVIGMKPLHGAALTLMDNCQAQAQETVETYGAPVTLIPGMSDPLDTQQISEFIKALKRA